VFIHWVKTTSQLLSRSMGGLMRPRPGLSSWNGKDTLGGGQAACADRTGRRVSGSGCTRGNDKGHYSVGCFPASATA